MSEVDEGIKAFSSKDYEKALSILNPLADAGNGSAQYFLGRMYRHGHGVEKDIVEAANLYKQAALNGEQMAMYYLAKMYLDGEGVEQSLMKSYVWVSLSASQGNQVAKTAQETLHENLSGKQKKNANEIIQELSVKIFGEEGKVKAEGCFIATATIGDRNHPDLRLLRNFRDFHLKKTTLGKLFVHIYYFASPPIAEYIKTSTISRKLSRMIIVKPLVLIVRRYFNSH